MHTSDIARFPFHGIGKNDGFNTRRARRRCRRLQGNRSRRHEPDGIPRKAHIGRSRCGGAAAAVMKSLWLAAAADTADVGATAAPAKKPKAIASATTFEERPNGPRADHDG